jgi:AbrB family looped-hinge helix DNA binding protein
MDTVTLSPKFEVAIPRAIREALQLAPGDQFHMMRYGDRLEFIPVKNIENLRGFARGMDTRIQRERDRE